MNGEVRVVEDGVPDAPSEPSPSEPSWPWLVVGCVVGLGLAALLFSEDPGEPAQISELGPEVPLPVADPELEQSQDVRTTMPPEAVGVGEVVEGFPDTLVAVVAFGDDELGYLAWPVAGRPIEAELAGHAAASVRFDASGRLLAIGAGGSNPERVNLSFGTPLRVIPEATEVTGYAWHDSQPGDLAYTQMVEGEEWLWVVDASRIPELVIRGSEFEGHLAAWGSWGFALQGEQNVTLLTPGGLFKAIVEGRVLDSSPDGWVATSGEGLSLVSAGGGVKRLDVDLDPIGEPESARFSPDGTKLVVVGDDGYLIVPLDDLEDQIHVPVRSGSADPAWSSDSRFVIAPWVRGVVFIDTNQDLSPVVGLTRHSIVALAAVPITER